MNVPLFARLRDVCVCVGGWQCVLRRRHLWALAVRALNQKIKNRKWSTKTVAESETLTPRSSGRNHRELLSFRRANHNASGGSWQTIRLHFDRAVTICLMNVDIDRQMNGKAGHASERRREREGKRTSAPIQPFIIISAIPSIHLCISSD